MAQHVRSNVREALPQQTAPVRTELFKTTMSNESISCPYCGKSIQLSKAISQEVDARLESELEARERILNRKHDVELQKARKEASVTAAAELSLEMEVLKGQVAESTSRLKHAQQLEIKLRRERQNVEAEKAELELRVDREIDERRKEIEASTLKRVSESQNLIIREKDQLLDQMKRQIEQLKQKAEQGSQQLQGECSNST